MILSVLGTKGGAGKSTVSMGIAMWMSKLKPEERVLLVEGDTHVQTIQLKMCPSADRTLSDVLSDRCDLLEAIYLCQLRSEGRPLYPNLSVLPAGAQFLPRLRGDPVEFLKVTKRKFDSIVAKFRELFQRTVVDTPASFGFEHLLLTSIADGLVYVVEPNDDSIDSTARTARGLERILGTKTVGVILNRLPGDEEEWKERARKVGRLLGVVPDDPLVEASFRQNLPVVAAYPTSPASMAIRTVAESLLNLEVEREPFSKKFGRAIKRLGE
ncbi:MAG: AAA family ATPase [Candidatus Hadarchaeales archaeon]